VSPLQDEKPQNRPLSKLNTGRLALRAMLPVKASNLRPLGIGEKEKEKQQTTETNIMACPLLRKGGHKK